MDVKNRIKEARTHLKLSQEALAIETNSKRSTIAGYESGVSLPHAEFLIALSTNYGINPNWILTGQGKMLLNPSQPEKTPIERSIEEKITAQTDPKFQIIETRLSRLERLLSAQISDSIEPDMYVSDPESEYGDDSVKAPLVENIAAGLPIHQWDDHSVYVDVPRRFIRTKPEDYYVARVKGTSMVAAGIPDGYQVLIRRSDTPRDGAIQVVEFQGEATLKRIREVPGNGWKICYEDYTGRVIPVGPGDEFQIQGDFVTVLPEKN